MNVQQFLETRIIPDYQKHLENTLKTIYEGSATHPLLTKQTAEFGLVLLAELPGFTRQRDYYYGFPNLSYGDKRYNRLVALFPENGWDNEDAYNFLVYIFGEEKAVYVKQAWNKFPHLMYQVGYDRRSFRSPGKKELYMPNQLNFLGNSISQVHKFEYSNDYKDVCYDLNIKEQIIWDHQHPSDCLFYLWAAAVDLGNAEVYTLLEDIVYNKDVIGKVSLGVIKALLLSDKPEAWQLVEKLLLAAQRQEGLRQTILEALDETSVGALIYMIKVLVDNKLTRFSSVVRAIDVWAGVSWETEKESAVNSFLQKAHEYLSDTSKIPDGIKSKNNTDVYMALWAQAIFDVEKTLPYLLQLSKDPSPEKRCVGLKFVMEAKHFELDMPVLFPGIADDNLAVNGIAIDILKDRISVNPAHYDHHYPDLFDKLHEMLSRSSLKEKDFDSIAFAWMNITYRRNWILATMVELILDKHERLDLLLDHFDEMDQYVKVALMKVILPDHSAYDWAPKEDQAPITDLQRAFCFRILKERAERLSATAFKALESVILTSKELAVFTEMLKRKSATTRGSIIALLLKQPETLLSGVVQDLLQGDAEQRLAGLDIALQLQQKQKQLPVLASLLETFRQRKTISPKEEVLLSQLSDSNEAVHFTAENGYGLYDPKQIPPVVTPVVDPTDKYGQYLSEGEYGFSVSKEHIKKAFEKLLAVLLEHKTYEYEALNYDLSKEKVLLANTFRQKQGYSHKYESPREAYEDYPLSEVWEQWYQSSGLSERDLFIFNEIAGYRDSFFFAERGVEFIAPYIPVREEYFPEGMNKFTQYSWYNPIKDIVQALSLIHPFEEYHELLLGATSRIFAALPDSILYDKRKDNETSFHYDWGSGWQCDNLLNHFIEKVNVHDLPDHLVEKCWQLYHWRQFTGMPENVGKNLPPLGLFCRAFKLGLISENEVYRGMLTPDHIRMLSGGQIYWKHADYLKVYPFLEPMFVKVREHLLDIELKRGDSATAVSEFVQEIVRLGGIHRFAQILKGLGKTPLFRGYYYSSEDYNKQQIFSALLKRCHPLETDTQEVFEDSMRNIKAPDTQLLEAAVYAPQWQKYVSRYLNWKGLDAAIWWMHAHTKTSAYKETSAEAESEIARYSAVDIDDFRDGAVDKEWFQKAYKEIGQERWQKVYDAAKYISDGNGHRRARLYADVMTGDLKIKEVTQKVKEKRDQDYLRIYGLVPLSKTNAEKDVLSRYEYIQQFKKESKQFGAQKQTSEALAIRVAMENLARNAGYTDPQRLTWAMETKQVQQILAKETQVRYDDVLIGLVIDEEGEADVVAFRDDKKLSSVPAKYKKDKKILELNEFKKTLREQLRRSRKALEDAMVRGDGFQLQEIVSLFEHPVISRHLEKLVFITEKGHGFYRNGELVPAKGNATKPGTDDLIRIAHCTDLYTNGEWSDYQRYCFEKGVKQPFRQIFRELYLPLTEELQEQSVSRRYAGHQVQPSQTVALLKSRGWKVDYEEGLQKVFHQEGFVAKMYAMANWFSPGEVESPVLEQVIFHDLKTHKNVAFKDIAPRIFSEVMRDIDLVVSVAHVGGVDPESSHSSLEMRTVLVKETARLFKLNNVTVGGTHVNIKGEYGEYSVHLGSAVVHQLPGRYLSVLPVHSQQRGRLFLPFVDDDPKSSELISKVILLARDKEIQDPTILQQLKF